MFVVGVGVWFEVRGFLWVRVVWWGFVFRY